MVKPTPHLRIDGWCYVCGGTGDEDIEHNDRRTPYYDFKEELIREMVARNHRPEEIWQRTVGIPALLTNIQCEECYEPWPCTTIMKLREWKRVYQ